MIKEQLFRPEIKESKVFIINCLLHESICTNICLFPSCNDSLLCPKCISKHNPQHLPKIYPIMDFLFNKNDGAFYSLESNLKDLGFSFNNLKHQFTEKYNQVIAGITNICKSAKETIIKSLDSYQNKCLSYVSNMFEKMSTNIIKMESQIENNNNFLSQFTTFNDNSTQTQKLKNFLNFYTLGAQNLKESLQKNLAEFLSMHVKLNSKEFSENLENFSKQSFLEPESLIIFSQQNSKSRMSSVELRQSVLIKPAKSFSMSPSQNEEDEHFNMNKGNLFSFVQHRKIDVDAQILSISNFQEKEMNYLIVGLYNGLLQFYDLDNYKKLYEINAHEGGIKVLLVNEDARTLITGSQDSLIKIWDISSLSKITNIKILSGHNNYVRSLLYLEGLRMIISGSEDRTIKMWDYATGDCLGTLIGHNKEVFSLGFINKQKKIISGGADGNLKIWAITNKECLKTIKAHQTMINSMLIIESINYIITGGADKMMKIWDTKDFAIIKILKGHSNYICALDFFNLDNKLFVASGSADNYVKIWSLDDGKCVKNLKGHKNWVYSVNFVKSVNALISGGSDKSLIIWKKEGEDIEEFNDKN